MDVLAASKYRAHWLSECVSNLNLCQPVPCDSETLSRTQTLSLHICVQPGCGFSKQIGEVIHFSMQVLLVTSDFAHSSSDSSFASTECWRRAIASVSFCSHHAAQVFARATVSIEQRRFAMMHGTLHQLADLISATLSAQNPSQDSVRGKNLGFTPSAWRS